MDVRHLLELPRAEDEVELAQTGAAERVYLREVQAQRQ